MRKIEFNELKLKNINNEESFYQYYLENLQNNIEEETCFTEPKRKYEIFYLNIFGGKIILLNTNYINSESNSEQELFFDYSTAYRIYNLMLDIEDGIDAERDEFNELYKDERLKKNEEIEQLKKQDTEKFLKKKEEYNIIINSEIYLKYLKLKEENEKLKNENAMLIEKSNNNLITKNKVGIFQKLINVFKNNS